MASIGLERIYSRFLPDKQVRESPITSASMDYRRARAIDECLAVALEKRDEVGEMPQNPLASLIRSFSLSNLKLRVKQLQDARRFDRDQKYTWN